MSLLFVLASIALLDSISIIPLAIVPISTYLSGKGPYLRAGSFVFGILVVYFLCGLVIYLGMSAVAEQLSEWFSNVLKHPSAVDLIIQIVLGLVMLFFGWKIASARAGSKESRDTVSSSPAGAFVLGAVITIVGIPGAVPFFGAVSEILRADLPVTAGYLLVLYYCIAFVLPLFLLICIRLVLPGKSTDIFSYVSRIAQVWGKWIIIVVLAVLGAAFVLDGVGWFLGTPLVKF